MRIEQDRQLQLRSVTLRKPLIERCRRSLKASSICLLSTTYTYTPFKTQVLTLTSSADFPSSVLPSSQARKEHKRELKPYLFTTRPLAFYRPMQWTRSLRRSAGQSNARTRNWWVSRQSGLMRRRWLYAVGSSGACSVGETVARPQNALSSSRDVWTRDPRRI